MKEIVKRTKLIIVVLIVGWALFGYFAIYFPMKTELQHTLYQYYVEISKTKHAALATSIQKSEEGARSLSSRTMIRDMIVSYQNGTIDLNELQAFTQPKYLDGVKALDHVVRAVRYVNQNEIARFQNDSFSLDDPWKDEEYDGELCADFLLADGEIYLAVRSPIVLNDNVLGSDCIIFNLGDLITMLNDKEQNVSIITDKEYSELVNDSKKLSLGLDEKDYEIVEKNKKIYYIQSVLKGYYLIVETERSSLLQPVYNLTIRVLGSEAIFFSGILIFVYLYLIRFAGRRLYASEKSIDQYKQMVNKDDLTGAYSKAFLEYWKGNLLDENSCYTIIMSDIDNFKKINDTYGHLSGDEALKAVAGTMQSAVRGDDLVIRFGGDEFLLILKGTGEEAARDIMNRIQRKLEEQDAFDFTLSVSYGISEANNKIDLNHAIEIADTRMYSSKHSKKR